VKTPVPENYVFDSFALLAYLEDEAGATRIEALLEQARKETTQIWMSVVNLGEVLYITEREQGLPQSRQVLAAIEQLPLIFVEVDRGLALSAAHIKANFPLAYADAFAIALAQHKNAYVVTGDREFEQVESLITVEWLPR
jgi:predicted nucleic acid-binding protein